MINLLDYSKKLFASLLVVIALPTLALAGGHEGGGLSTGDSVGITFWIISIAMVAATVFFIVERDRVSAKLKISKLSLCANVALSGSNASEPITVLSPTYKSPLALM